MIVTKVNSNCRDQQLSDVENHCDMKLSEDENRIPASSKISDIDKNSLGMSDSFVRFFYLFFIYFNHAFVLCNQEMQ